MFSNKKVTVLPFIQSLQRTTPARIGIGHCGGRYSTSAQLKFREDFAIAKDAVHREVPESLLESLGFLVLKTRATSRRDYLMQTTAGRRLEIESVARLKELAVMAPDVQMIASDGLSSEAFEKNVPQMWSLMTERLKKEGGLRIGTPLFVRWARVAVMDEIGECLKPKSSIILIGERPGLGISDSLSGYFEYQPCLERVESDRNVLSNVHEKGIPPTEAALMLAEAMIKVLTLKKSGMNVRFDFN